MKPDKPDSNKPTPPPKPKKKKPYWFRWKFCNCGDCFSCDWHDINKHWIQRYSTRSGRDAAMKSYDSSGYYIVDKGEDI